MKYSLAGKIFEVRPDSYPDKATGELKHFLVMTVEQMFTDSKGFRLKSTEDVTINDITKYDDLRKNLDKYIVFMYDFKTFGSKGSFLMVDDSIPYQIFDKNPLESKKV